MKKSIHELIINEALDNLKDTWEKYDNPRFFNSATFEEVLDAYEDYLKAKRINYEICRLHKRLSRKE